MIKNNITCIYSCNCIENEFCNDCVSTKKVPIYTKEKWKEDKIFNAQPHQEIEEAINDSFYECIPPIYLPSKNGVELFACSEITSIYKNMPLYRVFGKYNNKYYYMGQQYCKNRI